VTHRNSVRIDIMLAALERSLGWEAYFRWVLNSPRLTVRQEDRAQRDLLRQKAVSLEQWDELQREREHPLTRA